VPLPGDRVSLVWVDRPAEAERRQAWIRRRFPKKSSGELILSMATCAWTARRRCFRSARRWPSASPLAARSGRRSCPPVSPIGAQGLNLGFRDVAALGRVLIRYRDDPGAVPALNAYHAARQTDIRTRTLAVDLLNRSLLTDFLPVQGARGLGLALVSSVPMMRRALMRQGLAGVRH
jgi:2-octaprenyl-6-methoxyphenol hydroxylase